jgi:hypothetical protein
MTDDADESHGRDASDRTDYQRGLDIVADVARVFPSNSVACMRLIAAVGLLSEGAGQDVAALRRMHAEEHERSERLRAERDEWKRKHDAACAMRFVTPDEDVAALRAEVATAREQRDHELLRLSACGMVAMGLATLDECESCYSASLEDVAKLVDELATLRKRIAAAEALADQWDAESSPSPPRSYIAHKSRTPHQEGCEDTLDRCARELRAALTQDDECAGS